MRRRWSSYLWRGKAKILPVPWSPRVAERNTNTWVFYQGCYTCTCLLSLCQCLFCAKNLLTCAKWNHILLNAWVCLPSLPAGKLRRVIGSHATRHRCQELLSLLLHQAGCTDYLVARRPQVRPVHLLSQILHYHLQVSLVRNKENMQTHIYTKDWKFKFEKEICNVYLTRTVDKTWADYLADIIQS